LRELGFAGIALLFMPSLLAIVALVGVNFISRGEVSAAPYGKIFLLSRSLSDGPAKRYLEEHCQTRRYSLCNHLSELGGHTNKFMWEKNSPLYQIGIKQVGKEADEILKETFRTYPLWSLRISAGHFLHQLVRFDTGDWISPHLDNSTMDGIIARYFAGSYASHRISRQNTSSLHLDMVRPIHFATAVACLALLIPALILLIRRGEKQMVALGGTILLGLIINAAVCGPLSLVTDRYQSRVIWLVTLFVLLVTILVASRHSSIKLPPHMKFPVDI